MNASLVVRNRQRTRKVDTRHLGRIVRSLLAEDLLLEEFEIGIHLLGENAMVTLNESQLQHAGCTDVITFDYQDPALGNLLVGDIFVCVPETLRQAARFGVPWQQEILRYIVHGILHLRGFDDHAPADRAKMKREENRLVKRLEQRFNVRRIGGHGAGSK